MIVDDLLVRVYGAGGTLEPTGDWLRVRAPKPLPDDLLAELRMRKTEVLAYLRGTAELPAALGNWPEDWQEQFEERAAIMEYDGNLPRREAERRAEELVRAAYRRTGGRP